MLRIPFKLIPIFVCSVTCSRLTSASPTHSLNTNNESRLPEGGVEIANYDRGVFFVNSSNWDEAIICFSRVISIDPTNVMAYEYRGGAYFAKGDLDKSIYDFSREIELDPTSAVAYLHRGTAYRAKHEFEKALGDFNRCLQLNSSNGLAYKARASIYGGQGDSNKAIKDWTEGLRYEPDDANALAMRGFEYFLTSRFDKALDDFREALRIDPKNALAYNNLAWLRSTCPDPTMRNGIEATKAATKACELAAWNRWEWIDTLAAAYAETGDFERAIEYEKKAIDVGRARDQDRTLMERHLKLYQQGKTIQNGQKQ